MGRPLAAPLSFHYRIIFLFVNRKTAVPAERVQSLANRLELAGAAVACIRKDQRHPPEYGDIFGRLADLAPGCDQPALCRAVLCLDPRLQRLRPLTAATGHGQQLAIEMVVADTTF